MIRSNAQREMLLGKERRLIAHVARLKDVCRVVALERRALVSGAPIDPPADDKRTGKTPVKKEPAPPSAMKANLNPAAASEAAAAPLNADTGEIWRVRKMLEDLLHDLAHARASLREYNALTDESNPKRVIPSWQLETGEPQLSQALFGTRIAAGLDQAAMAKRLGLSQSAVARLERVCKENFTVESLEKWAEATGYVYLSSFVKPGTGYNDPNGISRLGVEATQIKGFYRDGGREALEIFLARLRRATDADTVTCFLGDHKLLSLAYDEGVHDRSRLIGLVQEDDVSFQLIRQPPDYVLDATQDPRFKDSGFTRREGLKSVFYLPFRSGGTFGIIFLSYRREMPKPSDDYWHLLRGMGYLAAYLLQEVTPTPAAHPYEDGFVDFLADLLAEQRAIVEQDVWQQKQISRILERMVEKLGPDVRCALYIRQPGGRFTLRNQCPSHITPGPAVEGDAGLVAQAIRERKAIIVDDLATRPDASMYPPPEGQAVGGMRSAIAAPVVTRADLWRSDEDVRPERAELIGVLSLESPRPQQFRDHHAALLERIGQTLSLILQAQCAMVRLLRYSPDGRPAKRRRILELVRTLLGKLKDTTSLRERLQMVAELINELFGSAVVDIWPADWSGGDVTFQTEEGVSAAAPWFLKGRDASELLKDLRPRPHGNSAGVVRNPHRELLVIENAEAYPTVNKKTLENDVGALIGAPIFGPGACGADGIIWIRFAKAMEFSPDVLDAVKTIAGFVHLIWNPASYQLLPAEPTDRPGVAESKSESEAAAVAGASA